MNKLILIFLAVAVSIGLANELGPKAGHRPWIDPRLEPAVSDWSRDVRSAGLDPETLLSSLDSIVVWPCKTGSVGHSNGNRVKIDPRVLDRGDASVHGVLYHELGHAVLGLDHGGEGIMSETAHRESEYQYYWPAWVEEYLNLGRDAEGI